MPQPLCHLLFDVMSTLVYDPIHEEIPTFFGLTLQELYDQKHPTAWQEFERGEISEQTFYTTYFPMRTEPVDATALRRVLADAYRWLPGVEELLQQLAEQGRPLHAFSNYPVWYEIIDEQLGLSRYLDWTFVSCNTGIRKPDPRAYLNAADHLGVAPSRCLFIDDRQKNCDAAIAVGMDAIRFTSAPQLRRELSIRSLL